MNHKVEIAAGVLGFASMLGAIVDQGTLVPNEAITVYPPIVSPEKLVAAREEIVLFQKRQAEAIAHGARVINVTSLTDDPQRLQDAFTTVQKEEEQEARREEYRREQTSGERGKRQNTAFFGGSMVLGAILAHTHRRGPQRVSNP